MLQRSRTPVVLVRRFLRTGIDEVGRTTNNMGFQDLIAFLRRRDVVDSAKILLERLCALSTLVHGAPKVTLRTAHGNFYMTRVFLSAYMLHLHVKEVFSTIGFVEMKVIRSVREMLSVFDELVLAIQEEGSNNNNSFFSFDKRRRTVPSEAAELCRRFNACLAQYFVDFKAWELADKKEEKPVWSRMRSSLVPLYFTYFYCPRRVSGGDHHHHRGGGDHHTRAKLHHQIIELRAKALENYGQAVLDEFDAELRVGMFGLPPIPSMEQLEALEADPKFFLLRSMDHAQMVHEIYLDVNFRTTVDGLKELPIHVYVTKDDSMHWNSIYCELLSFPVIFTTLRHTLVELKNQLISMIEEGSSRRRWVDESIDLSLLLAHTGGGWSECVDAIRAIMQVVKRVQIPIRDNETNKGWAAFETSTKLDTPETMVRALQFVLGCLKTTECDMHSVKMLLISRTLNDNGCMYIARKFQDMLNTGVMTMERTKAWVTSAVGTRLRSDAVDLRPRLTFIGVKKVLFTGLMQLLMSKKERLLNNEVDFPEVYLLDVWRLCSMQRKLRVDAAAICVAGYLRRMLEEEYRLDGTSGAGKILLDRVDQLFMSMDYGVRVSGRSCCCDDGVVFLWLFAHFF